MAQFITLTERDGHPVIINVSHIVFVDVVKDVVRVGTVTANFYVRESHQEVLNKVFG